MQAVRFFFSSCFVAKSTLFFLASQKLKQKLKWLWLIGKRISCRPILYVIILVFNTTYSWLTPALRSSDFVNHSYDYRPNWTITGPVTITNPQGNSNTSRFKNSSNPFEKIRTGQHLLCLTVKRKYDKIRSSDTGMRTYRRRKFLDDGKLKYFKSFFFVLNRQFSSLQTPRSSSSSLLMIH